MERNGCIKASLLRRRVQWRRLECGDDVRDPFVLAAYSFPITCVVVFNSRW